MSIESIKKLFNNKVKGIVYQIDSNDPLLKERLEGYFVNNNSTSEEDMYFVDTKTLAKVIEDIDSLVNNLDTTCDNLKKELEEAHNETMKSKNLAQDLLEDILDEILSDNKNVEGFEMDKRYFSNKFYRELK